MLLGNNLLLSLKTAVKTKLETPGSGLSGGFQVLSEDDIRRQTTPAAGSPPIYLVHTHIVPTQMTLPFVAVEVESGRSDPVEMGSVWGKNWYARIHIFAKSRAQRTDLATYLASPLVITDPLAVYDYSGSPAALLEYASIDITATRQWVVENYRDDFEGDWRNREVIEMQVLTMGVQ